jgi:hypothetical protein
MRTFTLLLLLSSFIASAQDEGRHSRHEFARYRKTELLVGMNWQADWRDENNSQTRTYIELGLAKAIHDQGMHGDAVAGIYASEEIHFGKKNIYGTKLGAYTHFWLIDLGFAMVYYTDFKKGNFKLRPELGFGAGPVRAVFGFNIPTIDNKAFEELRRHRAQVTVQVMIPVSKKKDTTRETTTQ